MKYFLLFIFLIITFTIRAQKIALLDEQFAEPVKFTGQVTVSDKYNHFFPVNKKTLPQFVKTLHEIEVALSSKESVAKDYTLGCITFKGRKISLASGPRTDYILTSTCGSIKIVMHLCDARVSNATNAFFIQTWIKYIGSYVK